MAVKPETTFIHSIHKYLPEGLHREKTNNPYSSGTADLWYSGDRADLWAEYKFIPKIPLRAGVWLTNPNVKKPMLSKLQEQWLRGRYEEGRNVCVIVGCPEGGVIVKHLDWEKPLSSSYLRTALMPRRDIAVQIALQTMKSR